MKLINKLNLVLLGVSLLTSSAFAGGTQIEGLEGMIAAADTSFRSVNTAPFNAFQTNEISNRLLAHSQMLMSPAPLDQDGQLFFHSASDATAMMHIDTRTHSIVFNMGTGDLGAQESTPALPSIEEAPAIAREILAQLDLSPSASEQMVIEHVGGLNMGVERAGGETAIFEKLRTVRFGRVLNDLRVLGRGSRVVVHLGEAGEMRGISHRWSELAPAPVAPAQKFSAQELRTMVDFRIRTAASHAKNVELTSAELVMYDDGLGVIEPAIRVELDMTIVSESRGENGEPVTTEIVNPLDFFVPVLRSGQADLPFVKDLRLQGMKPADPK